MKEDGKEWGGILYDDTESYRWLMDYFKGFEPEYIDIVTTHFDGTPMKKEELEEREFVFGYSGRLTPTSMYCSANGSFLYSVVDISLAEYNGRYAAKINLDSFHDTAKLLESGEAMEFLRQDHNEYTNQKTLLINLSVPKFDISSDMENAPPMCPECAPCTIFNPVIRISWACFSSCLFFKLSIFLPFLSVSFFYNKPFRMPSNE